MNDVPQSIPEGAAEPVPLTKGLANAREACGFSIADIARQLRLSPAQIEALESGDYQRLPGPVFVRGFLRNYARIVNLDPAPLLAGIAEQVPHAAVPAPGLVHSVDIPFPTGHEFPVKRYVVAGLLVIAALGVYEFYPEPSPEKVATSGRINLPPVAAVPEEKSAAAQTAAAQEPATDGAATLVQPARDASVPAAGEKSAPDATTAVPAEHLIRLNFDRDAWVEIRDRYGNKIFSQLSAGGTERAVSGLAPLSVIVGNANAVRLFYNDKRVDLAPYVKVDVGRLTLE